MPPAQRAPRRPCRTAAKAEVNAWRMVFGTALQLVRIYRKVENPIAFSESPLERKLTTGYLHARYAWLLLAPLQLSGKLPSL